MSPPLDDILAGRPTRRQALRAALAAAALTLPFAAAKVPKARAAGPTDCRKGCLWTAGRDVQTREAACVNRFVVDYVGSFLSLPFNPLGLQNGVRNLIQLESCRDRNVLTSKAAYYDCLQPDCPGFDPKKEGGPCDGCRDNCCPCQASEVGYICCIFLCDDPDHSCCPQS
jgi:hypothetical protein